MWLKFSKGPESCERSAFKNGAGIQPMAPMAFRIGNAGPVTLPAQSGHDDMVDGKRCKHRAHLRRQERECIHDETWAEMHDQASSGGIGTARQRHNVTAFCQGFSEAWHGVATSWEWRQRILAEVFCKKIRRRTRQAT